MAVISRTCRSSLSSINLRCIKWSGQASRQASPIAKPPGHRLSWRVAEACSTRALKTKWPTRLP